MIDKYIFKEVILRKYDIRGIYGQDLNIDDAYFLGKSFLTHIYNNSSNKDIKKIIIGYDGRFSSPKLKEALIDGIKSVSAEIINIGLVTTPMTYFASHYFNADGAIMITGSHNEANYNGFKILYQNQPFFENDILNIAKIAKKGQFVNNDFDSKVTDFDISDIYAKRIIKDSIISTNSNHNLKIAVDTGNGAGGPIVKKILKLLNLDNAILLFADIDPSFPNHHPDPTIESNLSDLKKSVLDNNCDLGIAFDGDVDRIGIIDNKGKMINPDELLILFARDILQENKNRYVISDVKSSYKLKKEIENNGGKYLIYKTGHSLIKAKMKELNAVIAGEMSGHIFFADKFYGFDDAIYAMIRLLNILIAHKVPMAKKFSDIIDSIEESIASPEIKIQTTEDKKFAIISEIANYLDQNNIIYNDIDGIRIDYDDRWFLIRASNTSPYLIARYEGNNYDNYLKAKNELYDLLRKFIKVNE